MSSANSQIAEVVSCQFSLPEELGQEVSAARKRWEQGNKTARLWQKDSSLWTGTDEGKWLWLVDIVDQQLADVAKFKALSAEVREDGFKHFLLLGMGGSSLCPEVLSMTYGKQ